MGSVDPHVIEQQCPSSLFAFSLIIWQAHIALSDTLMTGVSLILQIKTLAGNFSQMVAARITVLYLILTL